MQIFAMNKLCDKMVEIFLLYTGYLDYTNNI